MNLRRRFLLHLCLDEEEKRKGERKGKDTFLSRHLFIFTFKETTYNWTTDLEDIEVSPFTQKVGSAVLFSASVLEIFRLFFTTTLVATIVGETNRCAREVLGESAGAKWEDVVEEELSWDLLCLWESPQL